MVDNQKGTSSVGNFILLKAEFAWMHEKKKIEGKLAADQWEKVIQWSQILEPYLTHQGGHVLKMLELKNIF